MYKSNDLLHTIRVSSIMCNRELCKRIPSPVFLQVAITVQSLFANSETVTSISIPLIRRFLNVIVEQVDTGTNIWLIKANLIK